MIRRFLCTLLNNPALLSHDFFPRIKHHRTVLASQHHIHAGSGCIGFLCTLLNSALDRRAVLGFPACSSLGEDLMPGRFLCTLLNNPAHFRHDFSTQTKPFQTVLASQSKIHANRWCGDFLCTLLNNVLGNRSHSSLRTALIGEER